MDAVCIPYLPTSLWILAGATTVIILLIAFGFYIFWQKWATKIAGDGASVASLNATKTILEKDIEALRRWIDDQKAELSLMTQEQEKQRLLRAELADLEQKCAVKDQENQDLRNEVGKLENQKHNLAQTLERMQREIGDLGAKKAEAQTIDLRLAELKSRLAEAQQTIAKLAELEIKLHILSDQKTSLEREVKELRVATESARAESIRLKSEAAQAHAEFENTDRELTHIRREKAESEVIIDTLRHEQSALEHSVERLESKIEGLENKIEGLKSDAKIAEEETEKKTQQARQAEVEAERFGGYLITLRDKHRNLQNDVGALNARKSVLEREIAKMEAETDHRPGDDGESLAAYVDLIEEDKERACLPDNRFPAGPMTDVSEEEALRKLQETLISEGFYFSERVLNAFHTSLKVSDIIPLTVLAGVSGTGKSLLPVKYAEAMGMYSLIVSVQPRWDSPQDLFGFYNYLEHKYKATDLARALIRMDEFNFTPEQFPTLKGEKRSERMLLVLLDEMNLARTEYYFSEFLSKLEFRKISKDPSRRNQAEIVLDTGPRSKDIQLFRLWVGGNVLFVGTMNEDESTQTLSDKVLDRANVLRFGKPPENGNQQDAGKKSKGGNRSFLPYKLWESWLREPGVEPWRKSVDLLLSRLNETLNILGRPFGYRVREAIHTYIASYPGVIHNERLYKTALADQVELKLLPKLRGLEVSENAQPLDRIGEVIQELDDKLLLEQFGNCRRQAQNTTNLFTWRGVERPL